MSLTPCDTARTPVCGGPSPARSWLRALELTAPIARNPARLFSSVIEEWAETSGEAPALLSGRECMTYRALAERANQCTRWALQHGLGKGDTVCLLMPNRPEYMAIWLGITRTGCAVALVNTNLAGPSLAHSVNIVAPKHIIVAAELTDQLTSALPEFAHVARIWVHGNSRAGFDRFDLEIERHPAERLSQVERLPVTIEDHALYIYTSGTTGLPKAANVSHARLMQWSYWFAGMMDTDPSDRLYNCLPMYHSVGGIVATGAVLAAGGSVMVRENFSASQFWNDVVQSECTLFQYIGELCRYLLHAPENPVETQHRIRMCCGNGLRPDIWHRFKTRFRLPRILEFYAATEGNVSLFNVEGKPGAIGRIPSYLAHRFPATLVRFDIEKEEPVRNEQGFCIPTAPNETGEAIGRMFDDPSNAGNRFEGYTNSGESEKKLLRNVFEPGDVWFRTGDLMRSDELGYFYFVDRIGDTFRWKGENVSTTEVSEAICTFPGIRQANVYGVSIPGVDGRAGMVLIVSDEELDLANLRIHLGNRLPGYAHPLFLRLCSQLEVTATFKYTKNNLVREGYDPVAAEDVIYFNDRQRDAFVRLDRELYGRLRTGQVRL
ncbi:MAG: long-chain-acyl-CoA synthetase [Acidobacteriota bacterium]|nr:long-chain-acyl-CoA synthetase [Acidobacteriota bacterium]